MIPRPPLRPFSWNKTANFGNGVSPLLVERRDRDAAAPHNTPRSPQIVARAIRSCGEIDVITPPQSASLAAARRIARHRHHLPSDLNGPLIANAIGHDMATAVTPEDIKAKRPDLGEQDTPDRPQPAVIAHTLKQSFPAALSA